MKIDHVKLYQPVGQVTMDGKRTVTDRPPSESFANFLAEAEHAKSANATKPVSPLLSLEQMMAVSSVGDAMEQRKRGQKRGHKLLDRLDGLRHALLSGQLTTAQLEELVAALAIEKSEIDDPRLKELLDDIDLRAQVELAKYQSNNNL